MEGTKGKSLPGGCHACATLEKDLVNRGNFWVSGDSDIKCRECHPIKTTHTKGK